MQASIYLLIFLVLLSAFFSSAETGMMALNRYRLRHAARKKNNPTAKRILKLLERPDRLLGLILLGNTFVNILASSVATLIAVEYFGEKGILLSTIFLTLIILIFAETAPKTLAALYPECVAYRVSLPLKILLTVFYPIVWLVNGIANGCLRLLGVKWKDHTADPLSLEELSSVVHEATGKISSNYQQMLLRILELERVTVEDVMVPRSEITGIDLDDDWAKVLEQLKEAKHSHFPVYHESIDQVEGMLNVRRTLSAMQNNQMTKEYLLKLMDKNIYFVPEGVSLSKQLLTFRKEQKSIGLVVDEYGDIQGLITLQDILEEIVGEFSVEIEDAVNLVWQEKSGCYLVSAHVNVRELNRMMDWKLPVDGPKTLNGLVIEYIEMIPVKGLCMRVVGYPMEVVDVSDNMIKRLRVWPELYREV